MFVFAPGHGNRDCRGGAYLCLFEALNDLLASKSAYATYLKEKVQLFVIAKG